MKPTWGRVSRHGSFELAASLDHIGPMCRSATDAAIMLGAIAGADPNDPTARLDPVPDYLAAADGDLRGVRIGFDEHYALDNVDTDTRRAVEDALATVRGLGAEIVGLRFPTSARCSPTGDRRARSRPRWRMRRRSRRDVTPMARASPA
jgi:amidase